MLGAAPQLATAVWVGTDDNTALYNTWGGSMYGSNSPATIWKQTMDNALENSPLETWDIAPALGYGNPPVPEYVWTPSPNIATNDPEVETEEAPVEDPNAVIDTPAVDPTAPAEETGNGQVEILPGLTIPGDLLGIG